MPRTTTYRIAEQMVRLGWLRRTDGRYEIGHRLFEIASLTPSRSRLREAAIPYMQDLYEAAHETVHLAVIQDLEVLYVEKISGHNRATTASRVGGRLPLHCTGVGKAMLAHASGDFYDRIVEAGLKGYTERTITTQDRLRRELAAVRREGVAYDRGERDPDVRCVAAPVIVGGQAIAAVSITGSAHRFVPGRLSAAVRLASLGIARKMRCATAESN